MNRTKQLRLIAAAAVSCALLVPLTVYSGAGFAKSSSAAQYQYKIKICHHTGSKKHPTVTISVSSSAWKAHQKHHDTLGACPPPAPATAAAATAAASSSSTSTNSHANSHAADAASNGKAKGHNK
jgi:hypothetical protein